MFSHINCCKRERLFYNICPYLRFIKVSFRRVSCVVAMNFTSTLKHVIIIKLQEGGLRAING